MSGSHQTSPLFYPVRQLDHVCRVDAEEDVQDFRPLRPGLDPSEIVVLFLGPERAFHRSCPHSGNLLSDKVFLLFLLTELTASFYERCLYSVRLAVVPVFGSRVARISFSILPSRSSSLRVIFLVWLLLCLRCFLYVRFAFCSSRNFVRGRWIPSLLLNSHIVA